MAEAALDLRHADGVEVLLFHEWGGLTRFARSSIHQSTWRENTAVRVRVISGGRVGVAGSNDFSPEGARKAAVEALELAQVSVPDPNFPGLAPKADVPEKESGYDEATATATPTQRAESVAALVGQLTGGFHAAGAFETNASEVALANTKGQFCYAPTTQAKLTTVVAGAGSGAADVIAVKVGDIDPEAVGRRAFQKATDSQNAADLAPGRYEVVLEPPAVDTLVGFLSYIGLQGRLISEGRSPFSGKAGQKVVGENISIYDDALSPLLPGLPFDYEGTPKRRIDLISGGVFLTGAHDRRSAALTGTESNGCALPPPNPDGGLPLNLFLAPGEATLEEMIKSTSRGLLVSRFHYTNIVNPIETTLTGMTRDGTWLIEDGRIVGPVKNFRFTQSILDALSNVELIGAETETCAEIALTRVPALKIGSFNFSSASDH